MQNNTGKNEFHYNFNDERNFVITMTVVTRLWVGNIIKP